MLHNAQKLKIDARPFYFNLYLSFILVSSSMDDFFLFFTFRFVGKKEKRGKKIAAKIVEFKSWRSFLRSLLFNWRKKNNPPIVLQTSISLSLSLLHSLTHTHAHTHKFTKDTWATCKHYLGFVFYKCEFKIIEIVLGMNVLKAILFHALFFSEGLFLLSKLFLSILRRLLSIVLWHDMLCRDIKLT